ncbi:ferredoxin 2fe-2s-like protein [Leptomonas seymouri]|uniref:Ferredoxin 2fe-2s-like protein n=1 Tax=Leptomonas seymouri TaxID=5684 RepID=A0A0N1HYR7_LEPSE|nr:ferredoxin 2fe-2s-like protein [Leptomonas seymouri]|eukprot:KPI88081.1 ferredoxin 2fe-2s-like protein [Leptomonas seymouri]
MHRLAFLLPIWRCSSSRVFAQEWTLLASSRYYCTPGKIKVNITVQDGTQLEFSTPIGVSLMEAVRDVAQLDMDVSCQSKMCCSICHVYLCDGWYEKLPPPSEDELDTLEKALDPKDNSRLSCQVQLTAKEDGIVVVLPKHTVDLTKE